MAEQPGSPVPNRQTPEEIAKEKAALGPNATTTPPDDHHFVASDGKTKINAFGEVIGSDEDKKRKASA